MAKVDAGLAVLVLILWIGCSREDAAESTAGSQTPGCATTPCGIALSAVATISDAEALGELRQDIQRKVVRDERGRLLTGGFTGALVYHGDGSFATLLGRRGEGPGEFRLPVSPLLGPGDSVHVYDLLNRRVTVFAPDLTFARDVLFPQWPTLVLDDGTYVVVRQLSAPGHAGYPIHTVDAAGSIQRSFGSDTAQHPSDMDPVTDRVVSINAEGKIWAAAPGRYLLEKWDPGTGTREQRVEVDSDWFEPSFHYGKEGERPISTLDALWEDDDGLVWVLLHTADEQWRPPAPSDLLHERPTDPMEQRRKYDSIVEVIDPESGRVVASERFDMQFHVHPQGRILASVNLDDPELVAFDLWTARIDRE
jgi:hypothetical protein